MAYIVNNIALKDARLQIGAEEILRTMAWSSNWAYVRVGLRFIAHVGGAFDYFDFSLGLVQAPYGKTSPNCLDAIGADWNHFGTGNQGTATYNVAGWWSPGTGPGGYFAYRKVGQAVAGSTISTAFAYWPACPNGNSLLSACYVDITKTATGVTILGWAPTSSALALINVTRYQHLLNMETESAPLCSPGNAMANPSTVQTLTFTSNQLWDTVSLVWSRSTPVMDVHDLSVSRFY